MAKRISGAEYSSKVGATVRVVGKVASADYNSAQITTPDNTSIKIQASGAMTFTPGDVVEVVGSVQANLTLEEFQSVSFGQEFGMTLFSVFLWLWNTFGFLL